MATLLQSISTLIDNVTVTDRQEENITNSVSNLDKNLKKEDSGLDVLETFTNGSWERDTIIRPLDDVDIFAVLDREAWQDDDNELPSPQSVLTKMRNYLKDLNDYKDKVSQDRPCVTIKLSDKNFDVLPSFKVEGYDSYYMPDEDLQSWKITDPKTLTKDLNSANTVCSNKLKGVIRAIKYWNRETGKLIPSYHIEETAISLFGIFGFKNVEEAIRTWFNSAHLIPAEFKSYQLYEDATNKVEKVKKSLNDAKKKLDDGDEAEAKKIWKDLFGKEFPATDKEEARTYSQQLTEGKLTVGKTGMIAAASGIAAKQSGGFFGDVSEK